MKDYRNVPEGVDADEFINNKLDWAAIEDRREYLKLRYEAVRQEWNRIEEAIRQKKEEESKRASFTHCTKMLDRAYTVLIADEIFRRMLLESGRHTRFYARKLIRVELWNRLVAFRNRLRGY